MAIASLVLGILWMWGLGALLAVIFGVIGKRQIDQAAGSQSGRGVAIAGIVLGIVGLAGAAIVTMVVAGATGSAGSG